MAEYWKWFARLKRIVGPRIPLVLVSLRLWRGVGRRNPMCMFGIETNGWRGGVGFKPCYSRVNNYDLNGCYVQKNGQLWLLLFDIYNFHLLYCMIFFNNNFFRAVLNYTENHTLVKGSKSQFIFSILAWSIFKIFFSCSFYITCIFSSINLYKLILNSL